MKRPFRTIVALSIGVAVLVLVNPARTILAQGNVLRARAIVEGAPGSGISGMVLFTQAPADADQPQPTVEIVAQVEGLTRGLHGIHIHEIGSCADTTIPFGGAGGHFDPGPFGNSGPDINHPLHMGDIPNLNVNAAGIGHLHHVTSRITLSPGPVSVFDANGSAVVVHLNVDQGITGAAGSGVSGGARVACGVIEAL